MTSSDLIAALRLHDVTLAAAGDQLLIDGPENGVVDDAAIMWHVRDRKPELLAILTGDWIAAVRALVERERPGEADAWIESLEQRAGIYQFDANLNKGIAEELAYCEIADQIGETEKDACFVATSTRVPNGVLYGQSN